MPPKAQKALLLPSMILMPRQGADGGIGSFLTYPQMLMSLRRMREIYKKV